MVISDTSFKHGINKDCTISLENFPGIGQKSKMKLLNYYESEERALDALRRGLIGCAPGFTFKQGLKFAQTYFELTEGITIDNVIKTSDMMEIYSDLQNILMQYTQTEYSKQKLQFYFPLPSSKISLILDRQHYFFQAKQFYSQYFSSLEGKEENFTSLLKKLDTFKSLDSFPRVKTRIYVSESQKILNQLKSFDFSDSLIIEKIDFEKTLETTKIFQQYTKNFDVVIYIGTLATKIPDYPNLLCLTPQEVVPEVIFPEHIIKMFGSNKDLIQNLIKIVAAIKNTKENDLIKDFLPIIDLKILKQIKNNASILNSIGEIKTGIDLDLDCFRKTYKDFSSIIADFEGKINEEIQKEIGDRSIEIQGKQILNLFRADISSESLRTYIPAEVDELIAEIIHKNLDFVQKELLLKSENEETFTKLIPEIMEYPFQFAEEGIMTLEKAVSARYYTHNYNLMINIAKNLATTYDYLLELHQTMLEFEFFYAMGRVAYEFQLQIPNLQDASQSFWGMELLNITLQNEFLQNSKRIKTAPIPISYGFDTLSDMENYGIEMEYPNKTEKKLSQAPSILNDEKHLPHITLLTGSNSGGKTICLQTMAQAILLAQMGFPTVGQVFFYPFDELYYFKKSSGQISAGAFETTLLQFVEMAQSNAKKLILADELEAITEPNAAAKVLAGIFSLILQNEHNYGVFVTHLVELISLELDPIIRNKIRIDGIEAKGLDENLELIVDRNPKFNYIANSTPELILMRLAQSGSQNQKKFFTQVLNRFKTNPIE